MGNSSATHQTCHLPHTSFVVEKKVEMRLTKFIYEMVIYEVVVVWSVVVVLCIRGQVVVSQLVTDYLSPLHSSQSTEGLHTIQTSQLTMFLTEGLQDILPSDHHSFESQGMSSVVFKINVLIILMAVILFILFSLFLICFIM